MINAGLNFLKSVDSPKSFWESVYSWSLNIGRYIVIGTEIIVLTIFIVKIKISADLDNINQSISAQKTQLHALLPFEKNAEKVQSQLADYQILNKNKTMQDQNLGNIFNLIPPTVIITDAHINTASFEIKGIASDYNELQKLNDIFNKSSDSFKNVVVTQLSKDSTRYGIYFSLTASFN